MPSPRCSWTTWPTLAPAVAAAERLSATALPRRAAILPDVTPRFIVSSRPAGVTPCAEKDSMSGLPWNR